MAAMQCTSFFLKMSLVRQCSAKQCKFDDLMVPDNSLPADTLSSLAERCRVGNTLQHGEKCTFRLPAHPRRAGITCHRVENFVRSESNARRRNNTNCLCASSQCHDGEWLPPGPQCAGAGCSYDELSIPAGAIDISNNPVCKLGAEVPGGDFTVE